MRSSRRSLLAAVVTPLAAVLATVGLALPAVAAPADKAAPAGQAALAGQAAPADKAAPAGQAARAGQTVAAGQAAPAGEAAPAGTLDADRIAAAADHKATPLPLSTYSSVVVDGVQGHVFVSSSTDHAVVVTDLTGNVITTLTGLPGAAGMAISPDGDSLYVALSRGGAVAEIDTLTLAQVAQHPVGEVCPSKLAVTGNFLVFGYGCDVWEAGVGRATIEPFFGDVRLGLVTGEYAPPLVATSPGRPGLVGFGMPGLSPANIRTYRIVGDTFVLQASRDAGSNLRNIALSTDGSLFYAAAGSPYELQSFTTDTLAARAGYAVGAYPNSVAVSRDTNALAAGIDAPYDPDVYIYRNGQYTPSRTYDFADLETNQTLLAPAGLAWGPGAKWLYAITADYFNASPTLNILRG